MARRRFNKTKKFHNAIDQVYSPCIMTLGRSQVIALPTNVMMAARQTASEILWLVIRTDHIV